MNDIKISDSAIIAKKIQDAAKKARSETEIQFEIERLIKNYFESHNIEYDPKQNVTIIKGRPDTLYGKVIIEYKIPGSLQKSSKLDFALSETHDNIIEISKKSNTDRIKFVGIIIDGSHITFTKYRNNAWLNEPLGEVTTESIKRMLETLRGLSRKPLQPDLIVRDFGPDSVLAKECVAELYKIFHSSKEERTNVLYLEWKRIFNQVCGYEFISPKLSIKLLIDAYDLKTKNTDIAELLFVIHTYYALFIKMLSAEITATFASKTYNSFLEDLTKQNDKQFQQSLEELEEGGIFTEYGIKNFLEGDYFAWYLDSWNKTTQKIVHKIANKLLEYEPATTSLEPEVASDLLKNLYEKLVPKKIRHDLGEYFTPSWLVDTLIDEIDFSGNYTDRVLDPTCGSGSFIVNILKKIILKNKSNTIRKGVLLDHILKNVIGFDLNPLAIIAARANYLITISGLLPYRNHDIYIPIYLCDSLSIHSKETITGNICEVPTSVGTFKVPMSVLEHQSMEKIFSIIDESIKLMYSPEEFKKRLIYEVKDIEENAIFILLEMYNELLKLEQLKIDRIWTRVIKNSLAPYFVGKFDYIVGNPPWVNWEHLPKHYRTSISHLWERYALMDSSKGTTAFKRDISMTFVAVGIKKYLKDEGRLGLLIPFTLFKTRAGEGFRKFLANQCKVNSIHDMVRLKPFENAITRTSMIIVENGISKFPINGTSWNKNENMSLNSHLSIKDVIYHTTRKKIDVNPIEGKLKPESPWLFLKNDVVTAIKPVLGKSEYTAIEGSNTRGANGIFWLDLIEDVAGNIRIKNFTEGGKIKVEEITTTIEKDHIYALLRGREVKKWKTIPTKGILIPHDKKTGRVINENDLKIKTPKTYSYLSRFLRILESRKLYGKSIKNEFPFYTMFQINKKSFSPHIVVWKEISGAISGAGDFYASVVQYPKNHLLKNKEIISDHKLMAISLSTKEEACYVAGFLNSSPIRLIVAGYTIETSMSTHILKHVRIPKFNLNEPLHVEISQKVKSIEDLSEDKIKPVEYEIDQLVGKVYGISFSEIRGVQKSLENY